MTAPRDGPIKATVTQILKGDHGPYAASAPNNEPIKNLVPFITFELKVPTWTEKWLPQPGDIVILEEVTSRSTKKGERWRARKARFHRLSDMEEQGNE